MPTKTWAEQALARAREILEDDLIFPPTPVDPANETQIGVMTPLHLGLYTLMQKLSAATEQLLSRMNNSQGGDNQELCDTYQMSLEQIEIVENIFWYQLRADLKLWNAKLGVRKEGVVVSLHHRSVPSVQRVVGIIVLRDPRSPLNDLG